MACLFCKIVAGEIPSKKVFEDDLTYAFRDINPQAADAYSGGAAETRCIRWRRRARKTRRCWGIFIWLRRGLRRVRDCRRVSVR